MAISHINGTIPKTLLQLAKVDLLILDDFGISVLNSGNRSDLLEVIELRNGSCSTLVTSQLPVDRWHDYLGGNNPTIADPILDRLVTDAVHVVFKGNQSKRAPRKTKKAQS